MSFVLVASSIEDIGLAALTEVEITTTLKGVCGIDVFLLKQFKIVGSQGNGCPAPRRLPVTTPVTQRLGRGKKESHSRTAHITCSHYSLSRT